MLGRLYLSNFKSFKEVDIEFEDYNVVIGANAAGKSNLVQHFRFLVDIYKYGLEDAISNQGGVEFLTNRSTS